jgi:hypothetical protein
VNRAGGTASVSGVLPANEFHRNDFAPGKLFFQEFFGGEDFAEFLQRRIDFSRGK